VFFFAANYSAALMVREARPSSSKVKPERSHHVFNICALHEPLNDQKAVPIRLPALVQD
jgi:hypothetical protein